MKYLLFIVSVLLLISCSKDFEEVHLNTENGVSFLGEMEFVKTYGGSGEDSPQAIIATTDGGYAVLGFSNSTDGDLQGKQLAVNDYWLLRLDSHGEVLWSKTYGGS